MDGSTIEAVKNATDIVALIGNYVQLRKSGRSFKGLCPFHQEKTPSFHVSPERQTYHCFGCGAGGDAIAFLMDYLNMSFREAVEDLAEACGMEVSFDDRSDRNDVLYEIMSRSARFFRSNLRSPGGSRALEYLRAARKLSESTIEALGIGWAPAGSQLCEYSDSLLIDAGVGIRSEKTGRVYDRFRERVIFPIRNRRGVPVSFGGRALEDSVTPKYINGPDTAVYSKGHVLFGFREAREAARSADMIILVEGYFDLARLIECGYPASVATCGTALTSSQARQLSGAAADVFVAYDGDESGRNAAMRAATTLIAEGAYPFVVPMEPGHDPDSFLLERGNGAFDELVGRSLDAVSYRMSLAGNAPGRGMRESREIELVRELIELCAKAREPILREALLRKVSEKTGYTLEALSERLSSVGESRRRDHRSRGPASSMLPRERTILTAILLSPMGFEEPLLSFLEDGDITTKPAASLLRELLDQIRSGHAAPVLSELTEETRAVCAQLMAEGASPLSEEDRLRMIDRIRAQRRSARIERLRSGLTGAGPEERVAILREIDDLNRAARE